VDVVGPSNGVNVVVRVDGWIVLIGVELQTGINNSVFVERLSVLRLLIAISLSFDIENWIATLSNVSFSRT
jgi:hypothetical protein